MITRKESIERFKLEIEPVFQPILNKPVKVSFEEFVFTITLRAISFAKQDQLYHKPEKKDCDGKMRTPHMFVIETTNDETLEYALDDCKAYTLTNGAKIVIGNREHTFTLL